jgi:ribose transport system substrate-binding protein
MKRTVALAFSAAAVLAVSACNGGSTSGSGGDETDPQAVTDAQSVVDEATADVQPTLPEETPTPPGGKTIAVVECTAAASACVRGAEAVESAGDLLGWETVILDGQGTAAGANSAVQQAVSQRVDGIVLLAVPSANISAGMSAAADAGIPVVSIESENTVGSGATDVFGEPDSNSAEAGRMLAALLIAESDGKAQVGILHTTEFGSTQARYQGFVDELATCAGCAVVDEQNYLLSSAITNVPVLAGSMLQANPTMDYMFVDIGQFGGLAGQSIEQARKDVQVVSVDCNPDDLASIRDGGPQLGCAAFDLAGGGYAAVDDLIRAFTGNPPSDELEVPVKLIVASNVPDEDVWEGDFDGAEAFAAQWGVTA